MIIFKINKPPEKKSFKDESAWLEFRRTGIGGSDASAVLGLNPYKTNIELWEEKTGLREADTTIGSKPAVIYGKEAEQHLRELFKLDFPQYEVRHDELNTSIHGQFGFLFASLDGELYDKESGEFGILEIKTTNIMQAMHREKWNDRIPDNYYIQVLHYMNVTGATFAILKAQLKSEYGGNIILSTKHYRIDRNDVQDDLDLLLQKEIEFWTINVKKRIKPNLILPSL